MDDRRLFWLLMGVWSLAALFGWLGWLGEAPSLYIMPVVAVLAGLYASSLRSAAMVPTLALFPLILLFGASQAADGGLSIALVDQLLIMLVIHAVPAMVASVGIRWSLERFDLRPPVPA